VDQDFAAVVGVGGVYDGAGAIEAVLLSGCNGSVESGVAGEFSGRGQALVGRQDKALRVDDIEPIRTPIRHSMSMILSLYERRSGATRTYRQLTWLKQRGLFPYCSRLKRSLAHIIYRHLFCVTKISLLINAMFS
jgi:hypothetical protein